METSRVVPRDLRERRELNVIEAPPRTTTLDHLRLLQPVIRFRQRVVVGVAGGPGAHRQRNRGSVSP